MTFKNRKNSWPIRKIIQFASGEYVACLNIFRLLYVEKHQKTVYNQNKTDYVIGGLIFNPKFHILSITVGEAGHYVFNIRMEMTAYMSMPMYLMHMFTKNVILTEI